MDDNNLLQESGSYLTDENGENLLLESYLPLQANNFMFVRVDNGMSTGEKIR